MKIKQLNEEIKHLVLSNGLNVYIYNNENLTEYNANYTTLFGSNDLEYTVDNKKVVLPHGIAHFLEHVMFASESGDVFNLYAKNGASANAYTSYNQTSYIFSTAVNFLENLKILIEMVQTRYFTEEVVQKEMGIIEEEIIMYDQMPEWRLRNLMYEAICQKTNYKIDIAGTVKTINTITPQMLNQIFDVFYTPKNQILTLSGNFKNIDLEKELEAMQKINPKDFSIEMIKNKEELVENQIQQTYKHEMKNNQLKRATYTYKFAVEKDAKENMKNYFSLLSYLKAYFSNLNFEYETAKAEAKISENFGTNVSVTTDLSCLTFTVTGNDFIESTVEFIEKTMKLEKIDEKMLKLGLRRLLATEIRMTDNKDEFIEGVIGCQLDGITLNEYYDILFNMTQTDVYNQMKKMLNNCNKYLVVID